MDAQAERPSFLHRANLVRIAIALLAVLLSAAAQWWVPRTNSVFADEWMRDRFLQLGHSSAEERRILVVDIDEDSQRQLGPAPWPRARIADLVENLLTHYGAKGVALDIVMPEAGADRAGDQRLALLAEHGPVVIPVAFDFQSAQLHQVRDGRLAGGLPADPTRQAVAAKGYIGMYEALTRARHVGNIGFVPDPDGVLRRIPAWAGYGGKDYPALAMALLACCSGQPVPVVADGAFIRIDFKRDWSAFTVVSAADILNQSIDPASASGRHVVIGSSALGLGDLVATPLAAQRPGLGVHAEVLSNLLDRQAGLQPTPLPGAWIAVLYSAVVALGMLFLLPRVPAMASAAALALAAAGWVAVAWWLTPHDPAYVSTSPFISCLFMLAVAVPFQWQLTQQRSRHLLDTLRQYVAREVVDELLRRDLLNPLLPARCEVTTLIADMEGYTHQVESLPVEEATRLTRDFLDCLTGPVLAHHGTLDKYTGDGLVAFWGAPLPEPRHADLALDAARDIMARVERMSRQRVAAGYLPLRVRIGIESGPAMAGDFGTSFRSIYTAVGDSVNTASRLEQAARDFPYDVIIGKGTVDLAKRHRFMMLGERRLRGKENPTTLFTFADDKQPLPTDA
jgi:adenylate cyclase